MSEIRKDLKQIETKLLEIYSGEMAKEKRLLSGKM